MSRLQLKFGVFLRNIQEPQTNLWLFIPKLMWACWYHIAPPVSHNDPDAFNVVPWQQVKDIFCFLAAIKCITHSKKTQKYLQLFSQGLLQCFLNSLAWCENNSEWQEWRLHLFKMTCQTWHYTNSWPHMKYKINGFWGIMAHGLKCTNRLHYHIILYAETWVYKHMHTRTLSQKHTRTCHCAVRHSWQAETPWQLLWQKTLRRRGRWRTLCVHALRWRSWSWKTRHLYVKQPLLCRQQGHSVTLEARTGYICCAHELYMNGDKRKDQTHSFSMIKLCYLW